MDAKHLNRSKHHKKKKSSKSSKGDGTPEVFVLPPDLLQKLGINLGNVSNVTPKVDEKENAENGKRMLSPQKRNTLGEESILTTASLMKKSVSLMLSPTFVPTTSNMIPGEMEIACMEQNSHELIPKLSPKVDVTDAIVTTSVDDGESDYKPKDLPVINTVKKTGKHLMSVEVQEKSKENNFESAYNTPSSDCDVSNGKLSDVDHQNESHKKANKINIISEERLGPSKVKKLKTLCPNISDLTPVTKDTIISKQKNNDILKTIKDSEGQNIEEGEALLSGNYYTEAIIVMNQSENITNLNTNIDLSDKNTLPNVPIAVEAPHIHNLMNGYNVGSLENQATTFSVTENTEAICNGVHERNTDLSKYNQEIEVNDCVLHNPLITDCNIISSDEITDVILDVLDMSVDECSDHDIDAENSVVKFCNMIDANESCVENNYFLEHLTEKEHNIQKAIKAVDDDTNDIINIMKSSRIEYCNETDSNANIKLYSNVNNEINGNCTNEEQMSNHTNRDNINHDLKRPDTFDSDSDKQKCNNIVDRKHDKESMDGNQNAIQSKLCIQGVEKPGGMIEHIDFNSKNKILRTYQRTSKEKRLPIVNKWDKESCKVYCALEEDINYVPISKTNNSKEYCICRDFGSLDYYDSDHVYEHIHFWQHDKVNSDVQAIFSIYQDVNIVSEEKNDDDITELKETEEPEHSICWNNFKYGKSSHNNIVISEQQSQTLQIIEKETHPKNTVTNRISLEDSPQTSITMENDIVKHRSNLNSMQDKNDTSTNETQRLKQSKHVMKENINALPKSSSSATGTNDKASLVGNKKIEEGKTKSLQDRSKEKVMSQISHGVVNSKDLTPHEESRSNGEVVLVNEPVIDTKDQAKTVTITSDHSISNKETNIGKRAMIANKQPVESSKPNPDTTLATITKIVENESNEEHSSNDRNNETQIPTKLEKPEATHLHENVKTNLKIFTKNIKKINNEDRGRSKNSANGRKDEENILTRLEQQKPEATHRNENVKTTPKILKKNSTKVTNKNSDSEESKDTANDKKDEENIPTRLEQQKPEATRPRNNVKTIPKVFKNYSRKGNKEIDSEESQNVGQSEPAKMEQQKSDVIQTQENVQTSSQSSKSYIRKVNNEDGENDKKDESKNVTETEQQNVEAMESQESIDVTPKLYKKRGRKPKRKSSVLDTSTASTEEPDRKKNIKCGVCGALVWENKWENHIISQHQFVAWKAGETFDVDDKNLRKKLRQTLKITSYLKCTFCNLEIRCLDKFLTHIKACLDRVMNSAPVVCGVCKIKVPMTNWHEHIGKEHNYLAWIDSENPVDLQDSSAVRLHLQHVLKDYGDLICFKCGKGFKRAHSFIPHTETCNGNGEWLQDSSINSDLDRTTGSEVAGSQTSSSPKNERVTCAVCSEELFSSQWIDHIATKHSYLAWQVDSQPLALDSLDDVRNHLLIISRKQNGLTCVNCGLVRKRPLMFLGHIKTCTGNEELPDKLGNPDDSAHAKGANVNILDDLLKKEEPVTCAVCKQTMPTKYWIKHISEEHNYMAWQEGSTPLDINNEMNVRIHLTTIGKENGGLICHRCGLNSKHAKNYLDHIKETCEKTLNDSNLNISNASTSSRTSINTTISKLLDASIWDVRMIDTDKVKCAVCNVTMDKGKWLDHIGQQHYYRAWIEGQEEPDFDDQEYYYKFLTSVARVNKGLKCSKCGLVRKYPKVYLQHVEYCSGIGMVENADALKSQLECGVCHIKVDHAKWSNHAMDAHYNVAWYVGEDPIDLNSPYEVEVYIKRYQQRHKNLMCKTCGIVRISRVGFYAHIVLCGKTDEEQAMYLKHCDICNKNFLIIYTNQHMAAHRESVLAKERKQKRALEEAERKKTTEQPRVADFSNRSRRAAEKAKSVIQKYKDDSQKGSHQCCQCDFSTEIQSELDKHVCEAVSDSDESVKLDQSEEESADSDVDSTVSEEETKATSKRPTDLSAASRVPRIPFSIKGPKNFLKECGKDFVAMHMSTKDLFLEWRNSEYVHLSTDDEAKYLPILEESCLTKLTPSTEWTSYKRFEAKKHKYFSYSNYSMFVGGCVQSVQWVPVRSDNDSSETIFLSVSTHRGPDLPRLTWEQILEGPGLIQIWKLGNFTSEPEFVLGLAHDYGTIWAMSWCPSGARDNISEQKSGESARLGLLAVACSNGGAYIFSVPYPTGDTEKRCLKLKPVVELRISMGNNRSKYQATAVKWSAQKGHNLVVVGYSDGSVAYYDLSTDSPLLKVVEGNMTIFYPYHDEKFVKNCVEDLDVYPTLDSEWAVVTGASVAGCSASRRPGLSGTMSTQMAASQAMFQPHWPSTLLFGEEPLSGSKVVNEIEWWGGGRRFGGGRASAGCTRCGRLVVATLPLLRLVRALPFYPEPHKLVIGVVDVAPLNGKVIKKRNDDISMLVEPMTYDDTIKKYGIQYDFIIDKGKTLQRDLSTRPRTPYPERFPLADVTSLAFCPTMCHHDRLAVGLHGGFVIITSV